MRVPDYLNQFKDPDPAFSPVPAWWWSGERLDIDRMRWQMDQLAAMGIRNIVIINLAPSGTLFGADPDDPPYMSEPWWRIFEQVCDHARSIGMSIWFYDQIGFSGASYQAQIAGEHPEFLARQLSSVTVEGTGDLRVTCPGAATPLAAYIVPLGDAGDVKYVPLDGHVASATALEPSRLRLVYTTAQGYDFFSPDACAKLLDTVHGEFARRLPQHLGTTIVGSFQDELPDLSTWGRTFAETFASKFGYRIEDVIHRLFESGDADSRRTRLHYHAHRADLAEQAFFKPFFDWHERHGLRCGYDQQSPAREARVLGATAKYADYIQTQKWYAIPGSDLHGNGKLHASIAFLYGRSRVWLEGFHSTGWGGTIADTFDWLLPYLQSGANLYNPHAVYYSTVKGWWEWAPPSTCWRQPYARHYRPFAEMIARLTKILSRGVQQATVGVLFPTATVQSALGAQESFEGARAADQTLHEVMGSMRWHQVKQGPLDQIGLDYHILDEPSIVGAEVCEGSLQIGNVPIRTIILPHVTMLHGGTVERLRAFAAGGGMIVAVGADELEAEDGQRLRISTLPSATFVESAGALADVLRDAERFVRSPVPTLYRRDGDFHLLFVPASSGMATQVKWDNWFAPMEHTTIVPQRYRDRAELTLPASAKQAWLFDPRDGATRVVRTTTTDDGARLGLDFNGSPFAVAVWSDAEDSVTSAPGSAVPEQLLALSDEWTCEYVPTLPTEHADIYNPQRPHLRMPHTTDFQWRRANDSSSQTVRATFGARGWRGDAEGAEPQPIIYSPQFGIQRDKLHVLTIGPKGHVPDEFIDLGKLTKGQRVTLRFGVVSDGDREAIFAVGANAGKSASINGENVTEADPKYLWTAPVRLRRGENEIELQIMVLRDGAVRVFWCLLRADSLDAFKRPERIAPPEPAPSPGSRLTYRRRFELSEPIVDSQVKLSVAAMASVYLNGKLLGRQGGFDPYRPMIRGEIHQLPPLGAGAHELSVEILQPASGAPLIVDLLAHSEAGESFSLVSDRQWTISINGSSEQPVRVHLKPEADGAAWHLYRRPHPLPQARWIEKRPLQDSPVLDLELVPPLSEPVAQRFEWTLPPGATSMRLPLVDDAVVELLIDGRSIDISPEGTVFLAEDSLTPARTAALHVTSRQLGGGVFTDHVTYELGAGLLRTGSWLTQGHRSYSGAIRMRQSITIPAQSAKQITLDLGQVRGTVEASLNGRSLGIRCLMPYRFDITDHLTPGPNALELLVTNTLANHLSTWSPTTWWSPDQLECGVLGPVVLRITP